MKAMRRILFFMVFGVVVFLVGLSLSGGASTGASWYNTGSTIPVLGAPSNGPSAYAGSDDPPTTRGWTCAPCLNTTNDVDCDGWKNWEEVPGGGGAGAGDTIGSNPGDPDSTPEVCDGIDNDGNEGIDEGFPDTTPGGPKDCVDNAYDDDDDGIGNATDTNDDSWWVPLPPAWHHDMFPDDHENYLGTKREVRCAFDPPQGDNDPFDPYWEPRDGRCGIFDIMEFSLAYGTDVCTDDAYNRRMDLYGPDGKISIFDIMMFFEAPPAYGNVCPYGK